MATPSRVSILAFQVGFGDCFLLRFQYPGERRHVLIDFGSFPKASWLQDGGMRALAEAIEAECEGKLEAVVATHRHADHINGFTTEQDDPGSVIAGLNPDVVVLPWTEDPDALPTATRPTAAFMAGLAGGDEAAQTKAFARGRAFVASLAALQPLLPVIEREVAAMRAAGGEKADLADQLAFHGQNGLGNLSAVKNLLKMGEGGKARYVFHGSDAGLDTVLPGVKVSVLGPPTLEQTSTIKRYAESAPDEYWLTLTRAALTLAEQGAGFFPSDEGALSRHEAPAYARWLIERLRALRARHLLEIVRTLDGVLNNTSVMLLFEVGARKLLFPGDAQLENWTFALGQPGISAALKDVDFYKVGHHGSLNATPRTSVWENFSLRGHGLQTAMSTLGGVHGGKHGNPTEVPRSTLVTALEAESALVTTESLQKTAGAFAEVHVDV